MKYGLIGYPLSHSFSKILHNRLGNSEYDIVELKKDELDNFMNSKKFIGINVTIPYKREVIKYLDYVDFNAKCIGAVNTIKNIDGKLYGYNTDFFGFQNLLSKYEISVEGKNVLIIGTGATSETVFYVLNKLRAKNIYKLDRKKEIYKCNLTEDLNLSSANILHIDSLEELYKNNYLENINIIINTTPVGMYPHIDDDLLIDFNNFQNVESVVDVIYNPIRTKLLQEAEIRHKKIASGLYMLVSQGYFSDLIFRDDVNYKNINDKFLTEDKSNNEKLDKIYNEILWEKQNIVLVGMPSCGKSTIGKILSKELNKKFIDTDSEIEKIINMPIADFISKNGEAEFRKIEKEVLLNLVKEEGIILSTGGGAVLDDENVKNMKFNGKLFFINRSINKLKATDSRPLTSTFDKLKQKYDERLPIYKSVSDYEIDGDLELDEKISIIKKDIFN